MEFATYYFTLLVMLASVLAAATCFSAYLVSRSRAMILAFGGFLCYFIDVAFMLQDSIAAVVLGTSAGADASYLLMRSVATILIGDACLTFFWLLVCDFVGERRRSLMAVAPIAFLLLSLGLLMGADTPEGRFWFYSLRMIYVFWMLGFGLFRYLTCRDETERTRMAFVVVAVLAALVVAEDALLFLVLRTDGFMLGPILISSERNYAENLLALREAAGRRKRRARRAHRRQPAHLRTAPRPDRPRERSAAPHFAGEGQSEHRLDAHHCAEHREGVRAPPSAENRVRESPGPHPRFLAERLAA